MKDLRSALRAVLLADSNVNAAVQGNLTRAQGGSRIFSGVLPQGETGQSVVQNLISEGSDYHMQGPSGLVQSRIQIDSWATTQDAAVALAALVYDCLSGHSGAISFGSQSPQQEIVIQGIFHQQSRDDYDSVAKLHSRRRDYLVWYVEQ